MSSETSAQWPVVAPGFMYIVKMGDYTHILQPADQKSSEHLNLAQVAIRDINVARKLLYERGPFLLLDKQEKMDEMITETETAINRVIRILEPARVQHISEQSIRFNTRNPWALEDSPKSAATFGRLQITHNALKTVVHDLSNIEETVQLDDCNDRAEATPAIPSGSNPTPAPLMTQKGSETLLTWRRSRRANRYAQGNGAPSVRPAQKADRNGNDLFSPVSPEQRISEIPIGDPSRPHRDSVSEPDSSLQPDSALEYASDVSADRLPVIHELEGGSSIVQLGPVRPMNAALDDTNDADPSKGKLRAPGEPQKKRQHSVATSQPLQTARNNHNRMASTPPALRVTPPTLKQNNRMKRETFEELRRRNKEDKQSTEHAPSKEVQPSAYVAQAAPSRTVPVVDNSSIQAPGRFHSLKARFPTGAAKTKSLSNGVSDGTPTRERNAFPASQPPDPVIEKSKDVLNDTKQNLTEERRQKAKEAETSVRSASYPPVKTQLLAYPNADDPAIASSGSSEHILSPSRVQLSPLEQIQSPHVPESGEMSPLQPHERDHQIFAIDPELTRLPSLLRVARPQQSVESQPATRSRSNRPDDSHIPEDVMSAPVKEPLDRSVTAPPLSHHGIQASQELLQSIPTREDLGHLRSMSDTAVPQLSATQGPALPRKPLPYRNSPQPSREPSPHVVSRMATPLPERPQSELIQSTPNVPQSSKATSGPPSPIHSDHPRNLGAQIPRPPSIQSRQAQASSSAGSSRKSSVSADGAMDVDLATVGRPLRTNGLAMNPPEIPDRGASAYQAQSIVRDTQAKEAVQTPVQAPDYRSPAYQQMRHLFDPGHNLQSNQAPADILSTPSRFRDQDNQPRPAMMSAVRSKTVPEPGPNIQDAVNQAGQPRRASEHAIPSLLASQQQQPQPLGALQAPVLHEQAASMQPPPKPTPSPKPGEQNKFNFLQHQAAKLHARQKSSQHSNTPTGPLLPLQQVRQLQPAQALPLRVFLTPHQPQQISRPLPAPPPQAGAPNNAGGLASPQSIHNAVTTNQSPSGKPIIKDKDLLATKFFRPSMDKRSTPPKEVPGPVAPQTSQYPQQHQQQQQWYPQMQQQQAQPSQPSQPQPQILQQPQQQYIPHPPHQPPNLSPNSNPNPLASQSNPQPHECNCDDETNHVNKGETKSSESLKELIKMNNHLAQNVPMIPTTPMRNPARDSVAVSVQAGAQGQGQGHPQQAQAQAQAQAQGQSVSAAVSTPQKKKKSWLVHQAGKIAGKTGNG